MELNPILLAILLVVAIGLICAVMLTVASVVMAVPENELFAPLREALPGANCGACGYAGCDGYAKAMAEGEEKRANLCVPGGASCAAQVAGVLGVDAGSVEERVAVVFCGGDCTKTQAVMDYRGAKSCKGAKTLFGGAGACVHGCLGNGDCVAVCPVSAIHMEQGIAVVDREVCIGCGLCEKTCPNGIIGIMPKRQVVYDRCSNFERGKAVMDVCKVGCIGCGKCSKTCPSEAITMDNFLAQVDPTKCTACGACVEACPTHCMTMVKK